MATRVEGKSIKGTICREIVGEALAMEREEDQFGAEPPTTNLSITRFEGTAATAMETQCGESAIKIKEDRLVGMSRALRRPGRVVPKSEGGELQHQQREKVEREELAKEFDEKQRGQVNSATVLGGRTNSRGGNAARTAPTCWCRIGRGDPSAHEPASADDLARIASEQGEK